MSAPPFPYFGGKITLAPRIVSLFPSHGHYVEPFAGSLAVLMAKRPSRMETVNDLDGDLVHFWKTLRDRPDELMRACALTPHSRVEHQAAYELEVVDDVERARRVWVLLTQGRSAQLRKTGWRHYVNPGYSTSPMPTYLSGYVNRMAAVVERLQRVTLECRPALDVIASFSPHKDVLLYVDPPYLGSTRDSGGYRVEMKADGQHAELLDALAACRCAVVLSGYASPLYDDALPDWERVQFAAGTGQGAEWANRTEVLWSNRPIDAQPSLWDEVAS